MIEKGRGTGWKRGTAHHRAKWSDATVERARALHEQGFGYNTTAKLLSLEMTPSPSVWMIREWVQFRSRALP